MARANIPCRQCNKLHGKQVYADICCLPKRQEERRAMMELACRDLSTATLTALAEAGGVKRVLELLGQWNIVQEEIEWDESVPEPAVIQDTRLLLEKLGGVE